MTYPHRAFPRTYQIPDPPASPGSFSMPTDHEQWIDPDAFKKSRRPLSGYFAAVVCWPFEAATRLICRARGHDWSFADHGYCRRGFCWATREPGEDGDDD